MVAEVTQQGQELIGCFEARRLRAYRVPGDIPTIGWGHTSRSGPPLVHLGMVITAAEADRIFGDDLARYCAQLTPMFDHPESLLPHEWDALVSLAYNVGAHGFPTLLADVNAGRKFKASSEFLWYDHFNGGVSPGLHRRRRAEQAMFLGHVSEALAIAGAHDGSYVAKTVQRNPAAPPATA